MKKKKQKKFSFYDKLTEMLMKMTIWMSISLIYDLNGHVVVTACDRESRSIEKNTKKNGMNE